MFLKELFFFNRILFISFLSFIILFIFLNIKWGVVAYPVNQYGMYAGKYQAKDTQQVYVIYMNDQLLDFSKLAMAERDIIQYSLDLHVKERDNNAAVFSTMKKVLSKLLIGKLMRQTVYSNAADTGQFNSWFKNTLETITGKAVIHLDVYTQQYTWKGNRLEAAAPPLKQFSIGTNK